MEAFTNAQNLVWVNMVKHLLDPNYDSLWKYLETDILSKCHNDTSVLWKAYAPECDLIKFFNWLKPLRVGMYRDKIKQNRGFENYYLQDSVW